ncbi:hypothetical protein PoMZ_13062 [Pyricularia oryzae]|uniref:Uncharacterized protein n=1 Tax=Pyricularia oryzae TaxID=318829 RepID=A0A4P7NUL0_PYROR|nr:hypothetical protein PoMZ_13062 [Pyricularia oryzae]
MEQLKEIHRGKGIATMLSGKSTFRTYNAQGVLSATIWKIYLN